MTREKLAELHDARPLKPFDIHVADGDVIRVPHAEFLWLTPGGRTAYVVTGRGIDDDQVAIVDLLLVTKLTVNESNNGRRKKRAKKN